MRILTIDLETNSVNPLAQDIVGFSVKWDNEPPTYHSPDDLPQYTQYLESPDIIKVAWNLKFEYQKLKQYGIEIKPPYFDAQIAFWLLQKGVLKKVNSKYRLTYGLKSCAEKYLGKKDPYTWNDLVQEYNTKCHHKGCKHSWITYGWQWLHTDVVCPACDNKEIVHKKKAKKYKCKSSDVPAEHMAVYCNNDVQITYEAMQYAIPFMKEYELENLFYHLEMPIVQVLSEMELRGIGIDREYLSKLGKEIGEELKSLRTEIGYEDISLSSPKQLGELLFDILKLPIQGTTKTGQPCTGADVLEALEKRDPIVAKIKKWKTLWKLFTTYTETWVSLIKADERLHPDFIQASIPTGRLAACEPNPMQIPNRGKEAPRIRKSFIPREGWTLLSADYSQMDLRAMAHESQCPVMMNVFQTDQDIHADTAEGLKPRNPELNDKQLRDKAKSINFGVGYGKQAYGFAQDWECSEDEAQKFLDGWFGRYVGVKPWMQRHIDKTIKLGYVTTFLGRKRWTYEHKEELRIVAQDLSLAPDMRFSQKAQKWVDIQKWRREGAQRIAWNTTCQGATAEVIKLAMLKLDKKLDHNKCVIVNQIHDELWFECKAEYVQEIIPQIKHIMEHSAKLNVPLKANVQEGIMK